MDRESILESLSKIEKATRQIDIHANTRSVARILAEVYAIRITLNCYNKDF